jgi:predicted CopG family antitoxin
MHRKLTITIADEVYQGLHHKVGRGNISGFIEGLVRPHVVAESRLEDGYRAMAADAEREQEAREWIEATVDDALE